MDKEPEPKFPEWVWQMLNRPYRANGNERGLRLQKLLLERTRRRYPDEASQYALDVFDESSWYAPLVEKLFKAWGNEQEWKKISSEIKTELRRRYPNLPR